MPSPDRAPPKLKALGFFWDEEQSPGEFPEPAFVALSWGTSALLAEADALHPAPEDTERGYSFKGKPGRLQWLSTDLKALQGLKAVLFDLDDTLVQTTYFNDKSLDAAMKVLEDRGVALPQSKEETRAGLLTIKIKAGIEFRKAFPELEKLLGTTDKNVLVELTLAYDGAENENMRLFPGVSDLLRFLVGSGVDIGVITSGDTYRQRNKLIRTGMQDIFDVVLISEEVGMEKPDPRIYDAALQLLGLQPEECAFVGDKLDTDILGANRSGLVSMRVRQGRNAVTEPKSDEEKPDFDFPDMRRLFEIFTIALSTRSTPDIM